MKNDPLVSIPVITYNSSAYIVNGLESIKAQTYQNIELIISDDCSTDNTVEICRNWLDKNKDRFVRTLLVTTDKNTGVAGNCNRAVAPCRGEWIKGLSGDDVFLPFTVERYVDFVTKNPEVDICFAKLYLLSEDHTDLSPVEKFYEQLYDLIKQDLKSQQKNIVRRMFVPGPGLFYRKALWEEIGGFDEKYPFCDEDPFTNRVILNGHRIYFIDEKLYGYKVRYSSLSRSSRIVSRHIKDRGAYFFDERRKNLIKRGDILYALNETIMFKAIRSGSRFPWVKLFFLLSPLWYKNKALSILKGNNVAHY